ncbi:MAG: peptidoglycan-associated lipoprotein Pal [Pseudomonadota bacterium]|nr:peptidoglycan-associated lipoprotein Pal [Pseudomonadota bacterium]
MRIRSLAYLSAALFLLGACETMEEKGSSSSKGSGAKQPAAAAKSYSPPLGFTIAPGSGRDFVVNVGDRVFFALDKSSLSSDARGQLEKQVAWLKRFAGVSVTVEGHADERGTREYNLGLGERRANSVKDFLIAMGISPNRIKVISYGKERPAALGHTEDSWRQNRRAVTVVAGG